MEKRGASDEAPKMATAGHLNKCAKWPLPPLDQVKSETVDLTDINATQSPHHKPKKTFFDFAPELRNHIYELALGRPRLVVVVAPDKDLRDAFIPRTYRYERREPLVRPLQRRHKWEYVLSSSLGELKVGASASYELQDSDKQPHGRSMNLLLANKQVYREAASYFYDDVVVFDVSWGNFTKAPNAFLLNHSMAANFLRSLHLILPLPYGAEHTELSSDGDAATTWTATKAEPPFGMIELAERLSKINLRHFGFTLHGTVPFRKDRVDPEGSIRTTWWLNHIYKLGNLESLFLEIFCGPFYYGTKSTIPDAVEFCRTMQMELLGKATTPLPMKVAKLTPVGSWRPGILRVTFGNRKSETHHTGLSKVCVEKDISDWGDRMDEVLDPKFWDFE